MSTILFGLSIFCLVCVFITLAYYKERMEMLDEDNATLHIWDSVSFRIGKYGIGFFVAALIFFIAGLFI